jgi:hypothetical protein
MDESYWRIEDGGLPGCGVGAVVAIVREGSAARIVREDGGQIAELHPETTRQSSSPEGLTLTLVNEVEGWRVVLSRLAAPTPPGAPIANRTFSRARAREDARASWRSYQILLASKDVLGVSLRGRRVALTLRNLATQRNWLACRRALAILCAHHNASRWTAPAVRSHDPSDPVVAYTEAFCTEFRSLDVALRGELRRDPLGRVIDDVAVDEAAILEWIDTFAAFEDVDLETRLGIRTQWR